MVSVQPRRPNFEQRGRLQRRLEAGEFAVTAEVAPPRSASLSRVSRTAAAIKDWVEAANVTDGQGAVARMASWAASLGLLRNGVEPVMQLQCRDRNRIALQADLLGAAALNIPNVLLLTGDHPRFGDHPDAKPVFDLDSIQLIWLARKMRDQGRLLSERELAVAPRWFIGGAENPFAAPQRFRAERLGKKAAAGAQFCQTQYVFDVPAFVRWMQQVRDLGLEKRCYVLAGVGPIRNKRVLEHLLHLPGIYIPDEVARRIRGVPEDRSEAEALSLCAETIEQLREIPGVAGIHLIASGSAAFIPEVLMRAGIDRRAPLSSDPDGAQS